MQHRKSASMSVVGRPSGTDGSDFSYRMVVASRYTKVAQGKSRLCKLIITQAVIQLIGALYTFLSLAKEGPDVFAVSSIGVGFVSLLIGELGRRRSKASLLKVYMVASSIAVLISVACLTKSESAMAVRGWIFLQLLYIRLVIQDPSNLGTKKFGLLEISHALVGLLVHIFAISTTVSLIGNMSPPKKSS